jgi:hypothetical protein
MSWRTRHIRKRNKGKEKRRATKRSIQSGGSSVEKLKDIIAHLIETNENVSANINKLIVTIKFISDKEFTGVINGINGTFGFTLKRNIMLGGDIIVNKNRDSDNAKITGQKVVIDNLGDVEKIASSNKKNKEIKEKADLEIKEKADAVARKKATDENELAIKTQEIKDTYDVSKIDLGIFMIKVPVEGEIQPYPEPVLDHLSYCVEKYFMGAITIKEVKAFLELFQNSNSHIGEKPKIALDEVKNKLQLAIDMISSKKNMLGINIYSSSIKNELIEILKRLKAKQIEPSNKYSFDKEECKGDANTCFFMSCIKYFKLKRDMLDANTSIEDVVADGTLTDYDTLLFVSDNKNIESYLGCVCYKLDVYDNSNKTKYMHLKISKILKNEKPISEHNSEINKLIDALKRIIRVKIMHSMHIPNSLNEYVDKETNEIEKEGDDFTSWVMIPTESNIQTKRLFDDVTQKITTNLTEVLTTITTLYSVQEDVATKEEDALEVAPTKKEDASPTDEVSPKVEDASTKEEDVSTAQTGGSMMSFDLQKHSELQEIDEMIKSLPAYVYNKTKLLIEDTIGQVNKSVDTPDISSIKPIINKITRDSSAIKANLKTEILAKILPEVVQEENEFQKNKIIDASNHIVSEDVDETNDVNSNNLSNAEEKSEDVTSEVVQPEGATSEEDVTPKGATSEDVTSEDAIPEGVTSSIVTNEDKIKIKDSLNIILEKLKEKYLSTVQSGGSVSSILDEVLQKHPELNNTNIKQLFENIPSELVSELNVEEILKKVGESNVKVELTDPFITELTNDISSTTNLVDNAKKDAAPSSPLTESSQNDKVSEPTIELTNDISSTTNLVDNAKKDAAPSSPLTESSQNDKVSDPTIELTKDSSDATVLKSTESLIESSVKTSSEVPSTEVKEEPPLTLEDLKISPSMKNNQSNEMGKYIFVPDKMVQLVIDYLLSNGCEITTTVIKK